MGYTFEMFLQIGELGLPRGARILDVGSQDITINDSEQVEWLNWSAPLG